ncbi:MAG: HAMP domain-containing protein, partial [Propionibacteriaceae bacterium]|nr:HAMP domain-containing protein [Propionibacteriaceae bacterium]
MDAPRRAMRAIPIRWKLTLQYALLIAVGYGLFSLALYQGLEWQLYKLVDEQLRSQVNVTLANIRTNESGLELRSGAIPDEEGDEEFIRLLDADGVTLSLAPALMEEEQLSEDVVRAALRGQTILSTVRIDGDSVRVITTPVRAGDNIVGVLQVGLSRENVQEDLIELLGVLAIAAPFVLAGALAEGYMLAARALAPVAAITARAASINARDLSARLDLKLPDDELGRLARTFDGMLGRIEDAFERQRRFTGDAAHELRTPLSLMRSEVDLALARPRTPAEYREALTGLETDLQRLTGLVGTLLELARSDSGTLELERGEIDVAELVDLVREQFAAAAETAGVALAADARPCTATVDEDRLLQVLVNLVDNALNHTPRGGSVSIGCSPLPADGGVRIWVADTGVGIAPEHLPRLFDRFYRVDT